MQEFLEVMAPVSKNKLWSSKDGIEEPPIKVAAIEMPEDESDEEYEMVPKKARKESPQPEPMAITIAAASAPKAVEVIAEDVPSVPAAEISQPPVAFDADDDDWLRSRTNRMLDLVDDPNEAIKAAPVVAVQTTVDTVITDAVPEASTAADNTASKPSAGQTETLPGITIISTPSGEDAPAAATSTDETIEAIQKSGRLFVRNLPYTATEDDLKVHFEKYGALEEVCTPVLLSCRA